MGRGVQTIGVVLAAWLLACGGDDASGDADDGLASAGRGAEGEGADGAADDDESAQGEGSASAGDDDPRDTDGAGTGANGAGANDGVDTPMAMDEDPNASMEAVPRDPADFPVLGELDCTDAWPEAWVEVEQVIIDGINALREAGASCGAEGDLGPVSPLALDPALQRAARCQASYMAQQGGLERLGADGNDRHQRVATAGYSGMLLGWMVAAVVGDGTDVLERLSADDLNCSALLGADAVDLGVGVAPGGGRYYVEVTTAVP
jgi:uncharacterized protein YkwD